MFTTDADLLLEQLPDERVEFYRRANTVFYDLQLPFFVEQVDHLVQQAEQYDHDWLLDELNTLYNQYLVNLLVSHGVRLNEDNETPPMVLLSILEALINVQNATNPQAVMDQIDADKDDLPLMLGMLVEEFSLTDDTVTYSKVTAAVEEVDEALVEQLLDILEGALGITATLDDVGDNAMAKYRFIHNALYVRKPSLVKEAIHSGLSYGLPIATLWVHLKDKLLALVDDDPQGFVEELVSLVLVSDTPDTAVREATMLIINTEIGDENIAMTLLVKMNNVLEGATDGRQ